MKTIYTKVVADLFHHGHVSFFKSARELGDRLVVHVVDDGRVSMAKRRPVQTQIERLSIVSACRYVDQAMPDGPKVITRKFMESNCYHIYAFSFADERELAVKLADCPDLPKRMIGILKYTYEISTTELIKRILSRSEEYSKAGL